MQNLNEGFPTEILAEEARERHFVIVPPIDSDSGKFEFVEFEDPNCDEFEERTSYGQLSVTVTELDGTFTIEADQWYSSYGVCELQVNEFNLRQTLTAFAKLCEAFTESETDRDRGDTESGPHRFVSK